MGIYIKKRNNDEYIFFLAGKKQFLLGRKDQLEDINIEKVLDAAKELDKIYDKQTKHYIESMLTCTKFLDKKSSSSYLAKRREKIKDNVSKLK